MNIAAWVTNPVDSDRVAFHFEGQSITYGELAERVQTTALELIDAGITPGDRVGFCGLNRVELFEVLFASAHIGAIFLPFNNRLTAVELGAQIVHADPAIIIVSDGFGDLVRAAAPHHAVRDIDAEPFNRSASAAELSPEHDDPNATVVMVYTSGTTGQAKGAMLSHNSILHTVLNGVDHQQLTADDCIIAPLPTFHVGGLNIQTLPTLYVGGQVLLQRRFDPADVLRLITAHRPTQTLLVPAMLTAVASQPDFATTDLSSLRGVNTGSSVVPDAIMQPWFDRGVPVGQVYGTTETGPTAVVLGYAEAEAHIGSCGKPAMHTQVRFVDTDGDDVAAGTPGELIVRGPNLFTGYWKNQQATDAAFDDGWFRTGDVGFIDADGYITISDRITDMVISGGENIYPAELEPVLAEHPAIAEVAVIGQSNEQWGEIPVAVVVLVDGATLTIDELRTWCHDRLAKFKHPRALRPVAALPRTALGKVKKHELR